MAWVIVFEPKERPGQKDACICFTKFETSMQMKKFVQDGIFVHEIRKDGKIAFNRAQLARKFRANVVSRSKTQTPCRPVDK